MRRGAVASRSWRVGVLVAVLLFAAALPAQAAFKGRPGAVAFQSTRAGGLSVWLVDSDGTGLRQFTPGGGDRRPRARQYGPAISPNGRLVAYVASQDVGSRTWRNIFLKGINVRALNRSGRRVLRSPLPRPVDSVAFTPDGHRLVFAAVPRRGGGPDLELFMVRLGGRGLRQLTHNRVQDIEPSVSDSGLIAFSQLNDRGRPPLALFGPANLAVIRPHWRGRRLLTRGRIEDRDPSFAPFGNRIAYQRSFPRRSVPDRINEIDLKTRRSRSVFVGAQGPNGFDEPHNPAFSPAGYAIVFDRTTMDAFGQIDNPNLHLVGRDGLGLRFFTGLSGDYDTEPDWGPEP